MCGTKGVLLIQLWYCVFNVVLVTSYYSPVHSPKQKQNLGWIADHDILGRDCGWGRNPCVPDDSHLCYRVWRIMLRKGGIKRLDWKDWTAFVLGWGCGTVAGRCCSQLVALPTVKMARQGSDSSFVKMRGIPPLGPHPHHLTPSLFWHPGCSECCFTHDLL